MSTEEQNLATIADIRIDAIRELIDIFTMAGYQGVLSKPNPDDGKRTVADAAAVSVYNTREGDIKFNITNRVYERTLVDFLSKAGIKSRLQPVDTRFNSLLINVEQEGFREKMKRLKEIAIEEAAGYVVKAIRNSIPKDDASGCAVRGDEAAHIIAAAISGLRGLAERFEVTNLVTQFERDLEVARRDQEEMFEKQADRVMRF